MTIKNELNTAPYLKTDGKVWSARGPEQLDRIEEKMDRILELLEVQELSTSAIAKRVVKEAELNKYKEIQARRNFT